MASRKRKPRPRGPQIRMIVKPARGPAITEDMDEADAVQALGHIMDAHFGTGTKYSFVQTVAAGGGARVLRWRDGDALPDSDAWFGGAP